MGNILNFYKVKDKYGNFSNFANFPVFIEDKVWPTTEHYFQASKFLDPDLKEKIRMLNSPMKAAKEGRKKTYPIRQDWELVKDKKMYDALNAKFLQHPELRTELIKTKDAILIEHTKNDSYWADGGDGSGLNKLGKLLMRVRDGLNCISENPDLILPPWIPFRDINENDMFWRMGLGEDYLYVWSRYYLALENKENYQKLFPEPKDWEGFYDN